MTPQDEEKEIPYAQILSSDSTLYLDPAQMQRKFKAAFEKAMEKVRLPDGFEHGGANAPKFSGIRRHGPATMIMLIYRSATEEIKITVDVTLGT